MPYTPSAFQQILEPLDRRVLQRIVASHDGDRGVGNGANAWTCVRHLKTLLFAQIAGLNSLRDIIEALAARPTALYHLGLRRPCRSTLSDASAARPSEVFRDICEHLMKRLARKQRAEGEELIQLLDASPIPLRDLRFDWAEADARLRGLKLHLLYDPKADLPVRFAVTSPKTSDITNARDLKLEEGATYVFDKGYTDYGWWQDIHEAGAVFVTRLKGNAHRREVRPEPVSGESILAAYRLKIGHMAPRSGAENRLYDTELREIHVARDGKEPLRLITNDLERPAAKIAALYKQRWEIELVFKWIKQNLRIKTFLGMSENAVRIQIYVALIAYMLLRHFRATYAKSFKGGHKTLLARLTVALLQPFDLTQRHKPPPKPPNLRDPNPQLALQITC